MLMENFTIFSKFITFSNFSRKFCKIQEIYMCRGIGGGDPTKANQFIKPSEKINGNKKFYKNLRFFKFLKIFIESFAKIC